METGNRTTRYGDKHNAPDRRTVRMHTGEVIPDFRDHKLGMCKDSNDNSYRHDDQADSEYRVNPSDAGPTANTVPTITSRTTLNTRITFFIAFPR